MTRIAIVEREKCNPRGCGEFCVKKCPINKSKQECIVIGLNNKAEISETLCNGCSICTKCPYEAIHIINLPEKLKEDPVVRYNKNSFELFSLPLVKEDTVVGVIGRNGIGKSTALQILSGQIKPNFGKYSEVVSDSEIIKKYSTTLFGDYFKKLFTKEKKISYKPQRIELIAELYKGMTVKELIKKTDERKISEKIIKEFDLQAVLNNKVEALSGGELQRLAITAAICKDSDVVYLDEPSSFLDITHRIKMAKIVKEFCIGRAVIVIEHDLATLDYISDEVQIIYGEPSCYGIVSKSKSVSRGINEYLDGFLADDNIRFRSYPIKFSKVVENRLVSKYTLFDFPELEKKFEKFKLKINPGAVKKGEVMTIMGANGLGKTTFLKIIAGELKADSGNIRNVKFSYKPQYLNNQIDGTVEEYITKAAGADFMSGWYKQNILEKLGLGKILNNQVKHLSGGELQKLHIAACLSKDAELFLLDEPSAFVDVEDRLKVAEIIKDFIIKKDACAIVVDHDIQFIDYIGDSMIVFEGEPGVEGHVIGPLAKVEGMNRILKDLDITYRRDQESGRPRINKPGSQLDKKQRSEGKYYYS